MFKKWLAGILVTMMVVQPAGIYAGEILKEENEYAEAEVINEKFETNATGIESIANPRILPDETMDAGQKVTYDCIWFGEYPQAEVVPDKSKYIALSSDYLEEGDLIEDASLYSQLQSATYNSINETTIGGTRYRRMLKGDAKHVDNREYQWDENVTYHYFKYEPIKWRVIEKGSNFAFLLADKGLDAQYYNEVNMGEAVTWETCSLRNYLNSAFYDNAFNTTEKSMIIKSNVENANNLEYGTDGGNNTNDNVFLLSEKDVCKTKNYVDKSFADSMASLYGFIDNGSKQDEARTARISIYGKAMGARYEEMGPYMDSCVWFLRSPGSAPSAASAIYYLGYVSCGDEYYQVEAVRPALKIKLSALAESMYAGTVCTDGNVNETAKPENVIETPTVTPTPAPTVEPTPTAMPTMAPTVTPTPVVTVTPTPTPVPTIVPEPSPTVTATPTVEATATPISEAAPIVITTNESNNLIMDDGAKIEISGVDKSKLLVKGKSGTYDATTGTFKAIKKGTVKLYYLDGKKKVVVCTIKVEQPKLKASLKMKAGKTKKLKLSGTKRTDAVWSSSDESVASMSGGIVTAKKAGECDIIAKIGKHEWKCHVIVK